MPPGGLGGSGGVAVGAATRAPPANDPGPTSRSKEPYTISFPSLVRQIRATVTDSAQLESVQALVDDFADRRVEPASVQQRLSQIVGKSVVRSAISTLIRARKQAAVDDGDVATKRPRLNGATDVSSATTAERKLARRNSEAVSEGSWTDSQMRIVRESSSERLDLAFDGGAGMQCTDDAPPSAQQPELPATDVDAYSQLPPDTFRTLLAHSVRCDQGSCEQPWCARLKNKLSALQRLASRASSVAGSSSGCEVNSGSADDGGSGSGDGDGAGSGDGDGDGAGAGATQGDRPEPGGSPGRPESGGSPGSGDGSGDGSGETDGRLDAPAAAALPSNTTATTAAAPGGAPGAPGAPGAGRAAGAGASVLAAPLSLAPRTGSAGSVGSAAISLPPAPSGFEETLCLMYQRLQQWREDNAAPAMPPLLRCASGNADVIGAPGAAAPNPAAAAAAAAGASAGAADLADSNADASTAPLDAPMAMAPPDVPMAPPPATEPPSDAPMPPPAPVLPSMLLPSAAGYIGALGASAAGPAGPPLAPPSLTTPAAAGADVAAAAASGPSEAVGGASSSVAAVAPAPVPVTPLLPPPSFLPPPPAWMVKGGAAAAAAAGKDAAALPPALIAPPMSIEQLFGSSGGGGGGGGDDDDDGDGGGTPDAAAAPPAGPATAAEPRCGPESALPATSEELRSRLGTPFSVDGKLGHLRSMASAKGIQLDLNGKMAASPSLAALMRLEQMRQADRKAGGDAEGGGAPSAGGAPGGSAAEPREQPGVGGGAGAAAPPADAAGGAGATPRGQPMSRGISFDVDSKLSMLLGLDVDEAADASAQVSALAGGVIAAKLPIGGAARARERGAAGGAAGLSSEFVNAKSKRRARSGARAKADKPGERAAAAAAAAAASAEATAVKPEPLAPALGGDEGAEAGAGVEEEGPGAEYEEGALVEVLVDGALAAEHAAQPGADGPPSAPRRGAGARRWVPAVMVSYAGRAQYDVQLVRARAEEASPAADGGADVLCQPVAEPPGAAPAPSGGAAAGARALTAAAAAGGARTHVHSTCMRLRCAECTRHALEVTSVPTYCDGCERVLRHPLRSYMEFVADMQFACEQGAGLTGARLCVTCFRGLQAAGGGGGGGAAAAQPAAPPSATLTLHGVPIPAASFREVEIRRRRADGDDASSLSEAQNWVQCDECGHWQHWVCAGYNHAAHERARAKAGADAEEPPFHCAACRSARGGAARSVPHTSVLQLPETEMSRRIEAAVARALDEAGVQADPISVRITSAHPEVSTSNRAMVERRWSSGVSYPSEFPYVSRCIIGVQRQPLGEVLLFCMYVQEYGPRCPAPNTNRLYISYLDSVRYLQAEPAGQRTLVYHTLMVEYLALARLRGFEHVHVWVEPPKNGQEYIFHCRPAQDRLKPMKRDVLHAWYLKFLSAAKGAGVLLRYGGMAEEFASITSASQIPMFHGDQWEVTVPDLAKQQQQQSRHKAGPVGLRPAAAAADAPAADEASALMPPPPPPLAMSRAGCGAPGGSGLEMCRTVSKDLVSQLHKFMKRLQGHFLVGTLSPPAASDERLETAAEDARVASTLSPLMQSRQRLLLYCQANGLQFCTLRYARYSTMRILDELVHGTHAEEGAQLGAPALAARYCTAECRHGRADVGVLMVACDRCDSWVHAECVGLSERDVPRSYVCPQCALTARQEAPTDADDAMMGPVLASGPAAADPNADGAADREGNDRPPPL